jgi:hypothetical protein
VLSGDLRESILYGIESVGSLTETGEQTLFQQSKPCLYRRRGIQLFTDFGGEMSPNRIQRHNVIVQFRQGNLQERISPTRFEGHAEKLYVQRPVDDVIGAPQADPPTVRAGRKRLGMIRRIRLDSATEVDLQV